MSLVSNITPRYFTVFDGLIGTPCTVILSFRGLRCVRDLLFGGRNTTVCVFPLFIVSFQVLHHLLKLSIVFCSSLLIPCMVGAKARKAVSSANWNVRTLLGISGKSATYSRYNSGESDEPCGTPDFSKMGCESDSLMDIYAIRFVRKE